MGEILVGAEQSAAAYSCAGPVFTHPIAYVMSANARLPPTRSRAVQPALDAILSTLAPLPIGVGDRFEEIGASARQFEVVSIIRPGSGVLHARLRDVARPRARHFVSLRALLDQASYRLVRRVAGSPITVEVATIASELGQSKGLPLQLGGFIPERCATCPEL